MRLACPSSSGCRTRAVVTVYMEKPGPHHPLPSNLAGNKYAWAGLHIEVGRVDVQNDSGQPIVCSDLLSAANCPVEGCRGIRRAGAYKGCIAGHSGESKQGSSDPGNSQQPEHENQDDAQPTGKFDHRLTARDPLEPTASDWEREAAELIFAERQVSLSEVVPLLQA